MLKRHLNVLLTIALLLCPLVFVDQASARRGFPPDKWWETPEVAGQFDLSDQEKEALQEYHQRYSRQMAEIKSKLKEKRREVDALLEAEDLDEAAVIEKFQELETIRSEMGQVMIQALLEVRKILGGERYKKLKVFFWRHKK